MRRATLGLLLIVSIAVFTLPAGLLAALFVSLRIGFAVLIVGWLVLLPLFVLIGLYLSGRSFRSVAEGVERDPVRELQRRYVNGDIDEEEFDRKLAMLVNADGEEDSTTQLEPERER